MEIQGEPQHTSRVFNEKLTNSRILKDEKKQVKLIPIVYNPTQNVVSFQHVISIN